MKSTLTLERLETRAAPSDFLGLGIGDPNLIDQENYALPEGLNHLTESINIEETQKETVQTDLSLDASLNATYANRYSPRPGFFPQEGEVVQINAGVSQDNLSAFIWQNYNLPMDKITEVDIGATYSQQISEDLLGGTLSGRIGPQIWLFPQSGAKDSMDYILEGGIHYSGQVEVDTSISYIAPGSDADEGIMIHGSINKTVSFPSEDNHTVDINLGAKGAYLENFYGASGLSHISPEISVDTKLGELDLKLFSEYQIGINEDFESKPVYGITLSGNFSF